MSEPAKPPIATSASQKGLEYNAFSPWSAIAEKEIPRMMYADSADYRMVVDGTYPDDREPQKPVEASKAEHEIKNALGDDLKLKVGDYKIIWDKGEHPKDHPDYFKPKPDFSWRLDEWIKWKS